MQKKELEEFKEILLAKREELCLGQGEVKAGSIAIASVGGDSTYAFHMADVGTDNMEREKQFFFAFREQRYLKQIEAALERIEGGNYGICMSCRKSIPIERLEAVPTATRCIPCKEGGKNGNGV